LRERARELASGVQHNAGSSAADSLLEAVAVHIQAGGPLPWALEANEQASAGVAAAQAFAGGRRHERLDQS